MEQVDLIVLNYLSLHFGLILGALVSGSFELVLTLSLRGLIKYCDVIGKPEGLVCKASHCGR